MAIDDLGPVPAAHPQREAVSSEPGKGSLLNDPRVRSLFVQILLIAALVLFAGWIINNTATNLQRANIAAGFGFLEERAGFDRSVACRVQPGP